MAEPTDRPPVTIALPGQIERAQIIIDTLRKHLAEANETIVSLEVDVTVLNLRIAELVHTLEHINDDVEKEDGSDDERPDATA